MAKSRIRAPYDVLCRVIGNPVHKARPGERVAWEIELDGAKARVHSHDDDKPIQVGERTSMFESPNAIWHVEADDDARLTWVCARLAERVIESIAKTSGPRTLSAEDKLELNKLMKQGVSLSEAMKRVQLRADDKIARSLYAWPMKDMPLPFAAAPGATASAAASAAAASDDDDDEGEPAPTTKPAAAATTQPKSTKKVAVGPPIPADLPRGTIDAPFAKLVALLGEPEDKPIPFVSTRWRFVLERDRVVRWEDEPSDDPRDVDASIFDRMSRFDQPYVARESTTATWTITSSSQSHLDRVIAWLKAKLSPSADR